MKFDEIEFFNTAEIRDGVLYRFPLSVCDKLSIGEYDKNGQFIRDFNGHRESARTSYGIELRFETAAKNITLLIETARPTCVTVYNGDFQNTSLTTGQGRNEIKLSYPEILEGVGKESENRFGKNVWRIALDGEGDIRFRGLLTERGEKVSVPQSSECPEIKLGSPMARRLRRGAEPCVRS